MSLDLIVLGLAGSLATGIAWWVVSSIRALTTEIQALKIELARFEERLEHLPPGELLHRVKELEREIRILRGLPENGGPRALNGA